MDRFSTDSTVALDIYWLDKDTRPPPPPPQRVVAYRLINSINWIFMGQIDVKDDNDHWKTQIKNLHDFPSLCLIYRAIETWLTLGITCTPAVCFFLSGSVHPGMANDGQRSLLGGSEIAITRRRVFWINFDRFMAQEKLFVLYHVPVSDGVRINQRHVAAAEEAPPHHHHLFDGYQLHLHPTNGSLGVPRWVMGEQGMHSIQSSLCGGFFLLVLIWEKLLVERCIQ